MKILKVKCLAPTRLDNYLMQQYPALTPGRLNKALRENKIKLNGKKQPLSTRGVEERPRPGAGGVRLPADPHREQARRPFRGRPGR